MNNVSSVNVNQVNTKKPRRKKNIKGYLAARMAGYGVASVGTPLINLLAIKQVGKFNKTLSKDEIKIVNEGAKKVLENVTNLAKKGVCIENVSPDNYQLDNSLSAKILKYTLPETSAAFGNNAFYSSAFNSITINQEKLPLTVFHEMGHAFNYNNSTFWKNMQKSRPIAMALPLVFMGIVAFTRKHKAQEGEELSKKDKFINGLRSACPFLAGASMIPVIAEEAMATIRGNKFAKEVLSADLAKKVAKNNRIGLITYTTVAVVSALGAFVAKKIKDKSDEKKELQMNGNHNVNYHKMGPTKKGLGVPINLHQG